MKNNNNPKQQLDEIRKMMEQSSRFLSLSGLSGISAGLAAVIGATIVFFYLRFDVRYFDVTRYFGDQLYLAVPEKINGLVLIASAVLIFALSLSVFFTVYRAKKKNLKIWTKPTKQMLVSLVIPLLTGGLFCCFLLYYRLIFLIAPSTLIFYGLALLNAGKYTMPEILWLGISEIVLGLASCLIPGYGLLFWIVGFGILHILYGSVMYFRYERVNL